MRKRLLSLYPKAWRDRYREEMSALLEQTPAGITATLDLLRELGAEVVAIGVAPDGSLAHRTRRAR